MKTRKMNSKMKKYALMGSMMSAVLFLSGCMRFDQETGAPQGFLSEQLYNFLIIPLEQVLNYLGNFLGDYGLAIIVFTILFRLILLPLTLRQQKGTVESQVKMAFVQPVTSEIQEEMKLTDDPQEKQALQLELMEVYKENGINFGSQISSGCLPLLLQMPIFIAMFQVLRRSEAIANSSFLGIGLGESSIILAVVTGLIYFVQTRMMISNMPAEQQKTAGASMYISPIMMFVIGMSSPAGIALYWLVSGIFTLFQQLFNQQYFKPKIEKQVRDKMGDVEVVERKRKPRRNVTPVNDSNALNDSTSQDDRNRNGRKDRNAGKQQRRRNERD